MKMSGKRAVIVVAEGYTDPELWFPYYRFQEEGADVIIAGPEKGRVLGEGVLGKNGWPAEITHTIEDVAGLHFDILFFAGGIYAPLELRNMKSVQELTRRSFEQGKLVCAICHAPWILVSADIVRGKKISCPSDMAIDVINAGGIYVEDKAVLDGNLMTSVYFHTLPDMFRLLMDYFID